MHAQLDRRSLECLEDLSYVDKLRNYDRQRFIITSSVRSVPFSIIHLASCWTDWNTRCPSWHNTIMLACKASGRVGGSVVTSRHLCDYLRYGTNRVLKDDTFISRWIHLLDLSVALYRLGRPFVVESWRKNLLYDSGGQPC